MEIFCARNEDERELFEGEGVLPEELIKGSHVCMGAVNEEDDIVGALSASETANGIMELSFVFVKPDFRRQGIGRRLVEQLIAICASPVSGCDMLTVSYTSREDNQYVDAFFDALSFEQDEEKAPIYALRLSAFDALDKYREMKGSSRVIALRDATDREYRDMVDQLAHLKNISERFIVGVEEKESENANGHFYLIPDPKDAYDGRLSRLLMGKDGRCKGCLLASGTPKEERRDDKDELFLDYLCMLSSDASIDVLSLIGSAFAEAKQHYPADTTVWICALGEITGSILKKLLSEEPPVYGYAVARVMQM